MNFAIVPRRQRNLRIDKKTMRDGEEGGGEFGRLCYIKQQYYLRGVFYCNKYLKNSQVIDQSIILVNNSFALFNFKYCMYVLYKKGEKLQK